MFGRLPLYHASAFFFVVFNIACAVSGSLNQLIVFRFFAGSFGVSPIVNDNENKLLTTLIRQHLWHWVSVPWGFLYQPLY